MIPILLIIMILLLTGVGVVWLADWRLQRRIENEARTLLGVAANYQEPAVFRHGDLAELPEPVQRYLKRSVPDGHPLIRTVCLKQTGEMSPDGGEHWLPFEAVQYFTTKPPGFVWAARAQMMPLIWITARDKYTTGRGNMLIKPVSLFTLGDATGPEMDQGSLARYVAEAMWFPTALLPREQLQWQAVDDRSAQATIHDHHTAFTVTFFFNAEGDVVRVEGLRFREDDRQQHRWGGKVLAYGTFDGVRIPSEVEVYWHPEGSGYQPYYRSTITAAEYNTPELY